MPINFTPFFGFMSKVCVKFVLAIILMALGMGVGVKYLHLPAPEITRDASLVIAMFAAVASLLSEIPWPAKKFVHPLAKK